MREITDHKLMGDEVFDIQAIEGNSVDPAIEYQILAGGKVINTIKFQNNVVSTVNGVSEESIMAVLLDRLRSRHRTHSSREQAVAITKLEESLMWLQRLGRQRHLQGEAGRERGRQRTDAV